MTSKPLYERELVGPVGLGGTGYACAQEQATFAFAAEGHQGFRIFDVIDAPDGTRWRVIRGKVDAGHDLLPWSEGMTTTDIDAIMQAILEEPEDDLHRLAYADWHEEYGDPTRAEFIRLQIEFAGTLCTAEPDPEETLPRTADSMYCNNADCRHCMLDKMATAILRSNCLAWHIMPGPLAISQSDSGYHHWSRGFVSTARCTLREFMTRAAEMFRAQPITRVELTNRIPLRLGGESSWLMQEKKQCWVAGLVINHDMLPEKLFRLLPTYLDGTTGRLFFLTRRDANDALSAACVRYGRIAAGLEKPA